MKRSFLAAFFIALLGFYAFAQTDKDSFSLIVHITAVNAEQGQNGVYRSSLWCK